MAAIASAYTGTMTLRGTFLFAAVAGAVAAVVGTALVPTAEQASATQPAPTPAAPAEEMG